LDILVVPNAYMFDCVNVRP